MCWYVSRVPATSRLHPGYIPATIVWHRASLELDVTQPVISWMTRSCESMSDHIAGISSKHPFPYVQASPVGKTPSRLKMLHRSTACCSVMALSSSWFASVVLTSKSLPSQLRRTDSSDLEKPSVLALQDLFVFASLAEKMQTDAMDIKSYIPGLQLLHHGPRYKLCTVLPRASVLLHEVGLHVHKARHIREEQHTDGHALAFALGRPCNRNGSAARKSGSKRPCLDLCCCSGSCLSCKLLLLSNINGLRRLQVQQPVNFLKFRVYRVEDKGYVQGLGLGVYIYIYTHMGERHQQIRAWEHRPHHRLLQPPGQLPEPLADQELQAPVHPEPHHEQQQAAPQDQHPEQAPAGCSHIIN